MKVIHRKEQTTTKWSGGLTTELYIFPEGSDYKKRDFSFRLSTATVEIDKSTFTPLPGVDRTLMVLEGQMDLLHEGQHSSSLTPLQQDRFKGEWITESKGQCTDFNLMCQNEAQGELTGYALGTNEEKALNLKGISNFIYLYNGKLNANGIHLTAGDLLVIDEHTEVVSLNAMNESKLVLVSMVSL